MELAGLYIFSYLVGAVPTAFLIAKLANGVDIRHYGSGNVGGSNLFHLMGKYWVVPMGIFDVFLKGASPVWIGQYLMGLDRSSGLLIVAPLLALVGHNWSPYIKFQGGRGIAVAGGSLLALAPWILAAFVVIALAGWAVTRSSGVWVLIALATLPVWAGVARDPLIISWYCAGVLALVVFKRLLANRTPLPEDLPRRKVLLNRLFRDRDVDDRAEWISRNPRGAG